MKYVLGIFGFVILTVIAVLLLASATSQRGGRVQEGEKIVNMADYIDTGSVVYTTQGEIRGEESFRAYRITVRPNERRIQLFSGYTGAVEKELVFANNQPAFDAFMRALGNAGFTRERKTEQKDIRGTCPLGYRYVYEVQDKGQKITSLWSTTCDGREGTFGGDDDLVADLFENQIPNFEEFLVDVDI